MISKSEQTKDFILQKASPIFNRKGYGATSLSDLTKVTKLTKGAIYGNFESKEDLGVKAFQYNIKKVLKPLSVELKKKDNAIDKLFVLTNFYREYYDIAVHFGGCPVLNVATDSNSVNPKLFEAVKKIAKELESNLTQIIQDGINKKEVKRNVNAKMVAKNIYSMIEGSVFMAFMHKDKVYISEMMNHIDKTITQNLIN